jgi:hypothetical protein
MKTIIVGGQARDIGKTALVCAIIRAFPQCAWTAVKITGYGPDEYATQGPPYSLSEERDARGAGDSSRFLAAGARRSFWLRAPAGQLAPAMPELRAAIAGAANLIIESNRVLECLDPDLYLLLLDPARADFKETAKRFFDRADAYIVVSGPRSRVSGLGSQVPGHGSRVEGHGSRVTGLGSRVEGPRSQVPGSRSEAPVFTIEPGNWFTTALLHFIESCLEDKA